jgi:hypothetical protein
MKAKAPTGKATSDDSGTTWAGLSLGQRAAVFLQVFEYLAKNHGAEMSKRFWEFRAAHAKEIAAQDAEYEAAKKKAELKQYAEDGTFSDACVAKYLTAYHAGQIRFDFFDVAAPENELFSALHWCVVTNSPKELHGLAEAVRRVHGRSEGEGKSFKFCDAKPGLAKLVTECEKLALTSLGEGESLPTTKDQTIASGLSETVVKEVRKAFGVPPGKRGPKPKPQRPTVKKVSFKQVEADVAESTKQFWAKRKKGGKQNRSDGPPA